MRRAMLLIVLIFSSFSAEFAMSSDFSGTYNGVIAGVPTLLQLKQSGAALAGSMLPNNDSPYTITGSVAGGVASGTMVFTRDGAQFGFQAQVNGSGLVWTLVMFGFPLPDTATQFTRAGGTGGTPNTAGIPSGGSSSGTPANGAIDRVLVGLWAQEHSYTSGSFSAASETLVELRGDGSYSFGGSRSVGGGDMGAFDTGSSGESERGNWYTQGKVLYIKAQGDTGWQAYGRYGYTDDGNTVMIYLNNGKELWSRRR